jgi:nucleotide-binding universal stress UspA family protein
MVARSVVVGVDGSRYSLAAARWAAREALARGLPLKLLNAQLLPLHLLPTGPERTAVEQARGAGPAVESALARSHPGLEIGSLEVLGTPTSALLSASETAELMVLGARGCGGFAHLLVGSVSLHAATRAYCPVVLVRAPDSPSGGIPALAAAQDSAGEVPGAGVLVGVDARCPADGALRFAFETAERQTAPLRVVHAWGSEALVSCTAANDRRHGPWQESEGELLHEALSLWRKRYPDVEVEERAVFGRPAAVLVEAATATGTGLVVVGRHWASEPYRLRLGPVTHAVLQHVPATVAVVPHG